MLKPIIADALALAIFALLARLAHGGLTPLAWADTYWPFLLGSLIGWGLLAAVRRSAQGSGIPGGAVVWVVTVIVGLGIWGVRHAAFPHWSFILVASVMSALLMGCWRIVARWQSERAQAL